MPGGKVARNEMMRYKRGDGHDEFAKPHDERVSPAAEIAGDATDDHAEREREQNAYDADGQRDLRAVKHARKNIAPELVRAKKVNRILVVAGAEQMNGGWNQAEQFVFFAANKEMYRLRVADGGLINKIVPAFCSYRGTTRWKPCSFGHVGGWKKRSRVLTVVVVRRDETGEQRHEVKRNQNRAANHRNALPFQSAPEQLPRRQRHLRSQILC